MDISDLILQMPGLAPTYTKHPIFPDLVSSMIVATVISIGLNFAFALLRKKTTDIDRLTKVMQEQKNFNKEYRDAIKKQDKQRISELKKKQAYMTKMGMEMQQQQMRPMLLYMIPSFMLWILVFPTVFGSTVALSPLHVPWIMCTSDNVAKDTVLDDKGQPKGACTIPGEVFLWGWFLITSLGTSGIVAKLTKTSLPSMT
ncbi:MAG TPA: EMC3/TMCO1 family protein [Nitrososphaeraceae archaeon]|nr:EMC3/TMCO1 family protein [Nitrososphaeraceae archaeon]